MKHLRRELYRAYEISTQPVLRRQVLSDVGGGTEDLYEAHLFAARVQDRVDALPDDCGTLIRSKYGKRSDDLNRLSAEIQTAFDLPEQAAQTFIAYWLDIPGVQLQPLADLLNCSKSTISRKCIKVCTWLDAREVKSLAAYADKYVLESVV